MSCRLKSIRRLKSKRVDQDFDQDCVKCKENFCVICGGHPSAVLEKSQTSKHHSDGLKSKLYSNKFNVKMLKSLISKRTWVIGPETKITFKTLDLKKKKLIEVPLAVLQLTDFQAIRLDSNDLLSDITILGQLPNLRVAIIKNCNIQKLPFQTMLLIALELNNNSDLRDFGALSRFSRLQYLNIGRCSLHKIPHEVNDLRRLRVLCLDDNPLEEPLLDISCLEYLQVLLMKNCGLTIIPRSVFALKDLLYLSLEQNKITHVTSSLLQLRCLMVLSVYGNRGITLSPNITKCQHLKRVNVDLNFVIKGLNGKLKDLINIWKDTPSAWWKQI